MKMQKPLKHAPYPSQHVLAAGSIAEYARTVAADPEKALEILKKAKVITASGKLAAHYR